MDLRPLTPFVPPGGASPRPADRDTIGVAAPPSGAEFSQAPAVPARSLAHLAGASRMAALVNPMVILATLEKQKSLTAEMSV